MRGLILQILVLVSISDLGYCFPGYDDYSTQECFGDPKALACNGSPTSITMKTTITSSPAIMRHQRRDVDKLTATCNDDDVCSIWEVSSSVFTIITGPDYTPTATGSISLSTGSSISNESAPTSSPPFANSTTSSSNFTTLTPAGTVSVALTETSIFTPTSNATSYNSSTFPTNSTATSFGTGGSTGYPLTSSAGGIFTNTSIASSAISSSGTVLFSTNGVTTTHAPNGTSISGSAVSSGIFPSSSSNSSGVIWSNSSSSGLWPSKTVNGTNSSPTMAIPLWAPWTIWTTNSDVTPTGTARTPNSEATSYSASESTSYATTYIYPFPGTTYSFPIPASYTFLYGSTDTEPVPSETSSTIGVVPSDVSLSSSQTVSDVITTASTFGPTIQARPTSMTFDPALTPADTSSAFATTDSSSASAATFSSCFTTTPTYQFDIPSSSPAPTLVCWGFSCNNSTCSDWLSRYAITAFNATTTGAPYTNSTDVSLTGTYDTGVYPTGTYSNVAGSTTTNITNVIGTLARTVYPVPASTLTGGWGPWVGWTSTFSTSTTTSSVNDTDASSTQIEESGTITSQASSTGTDKVVLPTKPNDGPSGNENQLLRMGTPQYLRQMLQRRSLEAKRSHLEDTDSADNEKDASAVRRLLRGLME